jgi:hypothetical protein
LKIYLRPGFGWLQNNETKFLSDWTYSVNIASNILALLGLKPMPSEQEANEISLSPEGRHFLHVILGIYFP